MAALRRYAAGLLAGEEEAAVRRHLATGCIDCLGVVFRAPVGRPRPVPEDDDGARAWMVAAAAVAVVALTGTVLASAMLLGARGRSGATTARSDRRAEALAGRVTRAERRLEGVGTRSAQLATIVDDMLARPATASAAMATPRDVSPSRPADGRGLADLAASLSAPATRSAALRPESRGSLAHGWIAWDPVHGRLVVYAVGLPSLPAPWRALIETGAEARRARLRRLADGALWAVVDVPVAGGCARSVHIVPPDEDRIVLRGSVPCAEPRA